MGLEEDFLQAVDEVSNKINKTMSNDELKEVYALYKQASVGDINTTRPGMLDLKGKAKWDAWNTKKGMAQDEAKQKYVKLAIELREKHDMGLEEDFLQAVHEVSYKINKTMSNDELKEVYALYKQATVGDINTTRPDFRDLKEKSEWDALNAKAWDEAKQNNYVKLAIKFTEMVYALYKQATYKQDTYKQAPTRPDMFDLQVLWKEYRNI